MVAQRLVILKPLRPIDANHFPSLPPKIARQPGVSFRVNLLGLHAIAHAESRLRRGYWGSVGPGRRGFPCDGLAIGKRCVGISPVVREFFFEFGCRNHSRLSESVNPGVQPLFVVTRGKVERRFQRLYLITGTARNGRPEVPCNTRNAPFPRFVKNGLVSLDLDPPEPVHPTHIVYTVHP